MRVPPSILRGVALALWLSVSLSGQSSPLASLSGDLVALLQGSPSQPVRAIIRGDVAAIQLVAARDGLSVLKVLDGFVVVEADPTELNLLRQITGIKSISRDNIVSSLDVVAQKVIAADQARASQPGGFLGLGALPAVSGKGVGVAIVDSGINANHAALAGKVVAAVSFATGEPSTNDLFGHGTHVAGIVAGQETSVTPLYKGGVAPGAQLINVKVLNGTGGGYTSDVLAGIQWTIANRAKYGIKVMNLSLGHPVVEACVTDPLCIAVEKAVASGIVVVVSAGNNGKNAAGQEVFASITTPGVAPSAITVGALTTWGTVTRDDDTIATYSSRGPTRFELNIKPDVVAPGNKIISLEAENANLFKQNPNLHVAGSKNNAYAMMSGTSMAAPMVAGGVALLLEGANLTSRQIKISLQLSATFMPDAGVLRSGVGIVNLYSARRVNTAATALTGVIPPVTIAGQTIRPSGLLALSGTVDGTTAPVGTAVLSAVELLANWFNVAVPAKLSAIRGSQMIWGDQVPAQQMIWGDHTLGQQMIWGDRTPYGQQMIWGDHSVGQQMIWGDQTRGQQMIWGDQTRGQQMIWGDQTLGQQMIWGDQTNGQQMIWGDQTSGQQMIWGDQTKGQQMIWGDADTSHANQMIWGDSTRGDGQ